jgi:hypothetical protein
MDAENTGVAPADATTDAPAEGAEAPEAPETPAEETPAEAPQE